MSPNDLSKTHGFVALLCACAVCVSCSASESGGDGSRVLTPSEGGPGTVPESGGNGGVTPTAPRDDVIFDPDDIAQPGSGMTAGGEPGRRGLFDRQVRCGDGTTTTVSGTVYIPSGELPLYNAMVYVPDAELSPLAPGASCTCEVSGAPVVSAITDSSGHFVLENVPTGDDIPLVIQVGDWRREFNIGTVAPCVDTAIEDRTLKLPARRSEGDIPKIAVATGRLDALECLVQKLGVDLSEFTNPDGGGRVQLFSGYHGAPAYAPTLNGGSTFPPAEALWYDAESLQQYDIVLLSCEGDRTGYPANKGERAYQGMFDYTNGGGRMFASHFHSVWFQLGPPPFSELAEFTSESDREYANLSAEVVTTFPKGQAMAEWLVSSGVSPDGAVPIEGGAHTIVNENTTYAQRWLHTASPESVQYISANTPLGAADGEQCGRIVLSDIHVSPGDEGDDVSDPTVRFPDGCVSSGLSPQEAVLVFMLFDLSACIVPDSEAPVAPPIIR